MTTTPSDPSVRAGDIGVLVEARPITATAFAPFGTVIEVGDVVPQTINAGRCQRFSDLAAFEAVDGGRTGASLFQSDVRSLPLRVDLLERHPLGSQCFVPLGGSSYIVVVAPDEGGVPGAPLAFLAGPEQPVLIGRNVWHGVLSPIGGSGLFLVLDRIGAGENLEEYVLPAPFQVVLAD